jgi:hypothetical protein
MLKTTFQPVLKLKDVKFMTRNSVGQTRCIVRLLGKDKSLSSFDKKDASLPEVNPFNLPTTVNNAAGSFAFN